MHVCGSCFIAPYMALFHVLTMGRWGFFFFFSEEAENREWESTEALYQANNPWVYKEAWYSLFHVFDKFSELTFVTHYAVCQWI